MTDNEYTYTINTSTSSSGNRSGLPNTSGTVSDGIWDWGYRLKNRYETKTLKLLGNLSDIEIYYGINPEHDYIFVVGWNDELEDIYTKHNLYKLPNTNNRDDNQWVITGSTDDFKVFIDSLQNSPNYNAISTIDDILNDFVMNELKE